MQKLIEELELLVQSQVLEMDRSYTNLMFGTKREHLHTMDLYLRPETAQGILSLECSKSGRMKVPLGLLKRESI
jgi:glycyl-tRNA synthetase (class II)